MTLLKKEEENKRRLERILQKESEICKSYNNISKLDIETPDYLTFMAEMGKTLLDQRNLIEDLK